MRISTFALIVLLLLFSNSSILYAQDSSNDFGKISLSVFVPDNDNLTSSNITTLESKVHRLVTTNGLSGHGFNSNFVIYPTIEIFDEKLVEGMKNIFIVQVEFNLFIMQLSDKMIFSSYSKSITGSGYNKENAFRNVITKIPMRDQQLQSFLTEGKQKILNYYALKCNDILLEADGLIKRDKHEEAIALLLSVPFEASQCYSSAQSKAVTAYNIYKEKQCSKLLVEMKAAILKNHIGEALDIYAKMDPYTKCYKSANKLILDRREAICKQYLHKAEVAIASNDFFNASNFLMKINASTSCYNKSQDLLQEIEYKITYAEKLQYDRRRIKEKEDMEMEKYTIKAMKDIAITRYKNQPKKINFNYIFK